MDVSELEFGCANLPPCGRNYKLQCWGTPDLF